MVWVIAFGELFFGDLWCVVWGYGGMRTHFSLLNPTSSTRFQRYVFGSGKWKFLLWGWSQGGKAPAVVLMWLH